MEKKKRPMRDMTAVNFKPLLGGGHPHILKWQAHSPFLSRA